MCAESDRGQIDAVWRPRPEALAAKFEGQLDIARVNLNDGIVTDGHRRITGLLCDYGGIGEKLTAAVAYDRDIGYTALVQTRFTKVSDVNDLSQQPAPLLTLDITVADNRKLTPIGIEKELSILFNSSTSASSPIQAVGSHSWLLQPDRGRVRPTLDYAQTSNGQGCFCNLPNRR